MAKVIAPYKRLNDVALNRLHLNPQNPRFDPIENEPEIIAELFKSERVLVLAKDIAKKGGISPLDGIGVIEMPGNPGHFIVAEGNRRASALKVLIDPRKAPNPTAQKAIEAIEGRAALAKSFEVIVFRDLDAARPWLELRHLGEQDGAGTRPWNPQQKTRFSRGGSPDQLALEILDRAEELGWIDEGQRKRIPLTTLTRYLGSPNVRTALGLASRSTLSFTHDPAQVDEALRQFVLDAIPKTGGKPGRVHSRSDSAARQKYSQELNSQRILTSPPARGPDAAPSRAFKRCKEEDTCAPSTAS